MTVRAPDEVRYVYSFGAGEAEGGSDMVRLLGGKGSNLHEMTRLGVPVPPGFTVSTEACRRYFDAGGELPAGLSAEVEAGLERVEELTGSRFGDPADPLLFSVRSGAPVSMPGMMDTVLNLGLNDRTTQGLAERTGDPRFAYDSQRRLVQMYGDVVKGVEGERFEELLAAKKEDRGVREDTELDAEGLRELVDEFRSLYREVTGESFPEDPMEQLWEAVAAVFDSWNTPRAVKWRDIQGLPHDVGTAANVQSMVFGNMGDDSASGVAFTRDPATGEKEPIGEYLPNAQGEDVVSGVRTPRPLNDYVRRHGGRDLPSLEERMPEVYEQLVDTFHVLEEHYREMQDVEFTVQEGELFILQTRTGKRTAAAMVKIAHDMSDEDLISREKALDRLDASRLSQLLHPTIAGEAREENEPVAVGLGASPGGAAGKVVFDAETAESRAADGEAVILVRKETSPDDVGGMHAAEGVVTSRGGSTSHAAVVARGMGKPCVAGCSALEVDVEERRFQVEGRTVEEGDWITLDGASGEVFLGRLEMEGVSLSPEFRTVMGWADEFRRLGVRANADTPEDARRARQFGAEGIGLCRTEHMFFHADRVQWVREMILVAPEVRRLRAELEALAAKKEGAGHRRRVELEHRSRELRRRLDEVLPEFTEALHKLLPEQRSDFAAIFEAMDGQPVTIRLLDPPLHEFLPREPEEREALAESLGRTRSEIDQLVENLTEVNPMLGHRGCRLGISYPEIYEMQARAAFEAAADVAEEGVEVELEIMIPLVAIPEEFDRLRERVDAVAGEVREERGAEVKYRVGTMIELPRAALRAEKLATSAEFFSFGTNDLTQTTYGISRDDARNFLEPYRQVGILSDDPFEVLDQEGVGALVRIAVERGRSTSPELSTGICGEHGGEPSSVRFCHEAGLDYVSCSPYRVPVARVAAAQAAVDVEKDLTSY